MVQLLWNGSRADTHALPAHSKRRAGADDVYDRFSFGGTGTPLGPGEYDGAAARWPGATPAGGWPHEAAAESADVPSARPRSPPFGRSAKPRAPLFIDSHVAPPFGRVKPDAGRAPRAAMSAHHRPQSCLRARSAPGSVPSWDVLAQARNGPDPDEAHRLSFLRQVGADERDVCMGVERDMCMWHTREKSGSKQRVRMIRTREVRDARERRRRWRG